MEVSFQKVLEEQQCFSLKDLAIGGKDLMELGIKPGPGIGEMLSRALELVLEEPEKNNRDELLHFLLDESEG